MSGSRRSFDSTGLTDSRSGRRGVQQSRCASCRSPTTETGGGSCNRWWGRYRKFVACANAKNPADPFIDPKGYRAYIDTAEAEFRNGRTY
jgi:hypothetical protein